MRLLDEIATRSTLVGDTLAEGMDWALAVFGMSELVGHQQGAGPGRLRATKAQGHGPQLRRQPARRLPPSGDLLQAGTWRPSGRHGRRRRTFRPTSTGKTGCSCSTASRCAVSTGTLSAGTSSSSAATQLNGAPVEQAGARGAVHRHAHAHPPPESCLRAASGRRHRRRAVLHARPPTRRPPSTGTELERRVRIYWVKRGWGEEGYPPASSRRRT